MTPEVLPDKLAGLLAPVSVSQPCGSWLRHDSVYQRIAEARREDDVRLPQGIWEQALKRADWALVEQLCEHALAHRSKDLQIAAWLAEAWLRQRGLPGLSDGLHLLAGLLEHYWEGVFPQMERGDTEYRVAPFVWLNKNVVLALGSVQVAAGASPAGRLFTLLEWSQVLRREQQGGSARKDTAATASDEVVLTRQHFSTAVSMTPQRFYADMQDQLRGADAALRQLAQVLEHCLGDDTPALSGIQGRLDDCAQVVQELAGVRWPEETQALQQEEAMDSVQELPAARAADAGGALRSRDEAYRRLEEVAEYLMRTEPHSPVPYLVRRAVTWGKLPLGELLQELLDSESDLKQINRLLGTRGH